MTAFTQAAASYADTAREAQRRKDQDRADREELLETAKEDGVGIVHIYAPESPKGGLTIAFRKSTVYKAGVMVDCAVNTCSHEDSFNKKIGLLGALEKFYAGQTIQLPILRNYEVNNLNFAIKNAFTALYFLA